MHFNKLDLNLLVALDAMLTETSISRAAERLHLSQSAMSNALARLRSYFDDELLVQVGRRMELTPRAEALKEAVRDVLVRIDTTVASQPEFDLARTDREFRIFASDYTQVMLMPHLLALARQQAPGVRFEFLPQVVQPQRALERGEADLMIIPRGFDSADHPSDVLFEEEFCCLVWNGSALARETLSFERYLAADHVVMKPAGTDHPSFESWFVQRFGVSRRIAVTTYSFSAVPALLVGSDCLATVHARMAAQVQGMLPLTRLRPPVQMSKLEQLMQWHKYRTRDPGLSWLRALVHEAARRMDLGLSAL